MKASTVIAVAAGLTAYTVSAQLDQLPSCALSCAIGSLGKTGCPTTDIACICSATSFLTELTPCVQKACTAAEFETTLAAAGVLCQSAGVTLSIPVPGASSTTAAPSSSEPASTMTTSVVSTTETVVEPPVTNATTTSTEDSAPVPTNGTTSTVEPPKPSGTDGSSASRNAVALGGLGALAAFVAALL